MGARSADRGVRSAECGVRRVSTQEKARKCRDAEMNYDRTPPLLACIVQVAPFSHTAAQAAHMETTRERSRTEDSEGNQR